MHKNNPSPGRLRIINQLPPIFFPLISIIVGIYCQEIFPFNLIVLLLSTITSFALLLFLKKTKNLKNLQILSCLTCLFSAMLLLQQQKENHSYLLNKFCNKKLEVIANIKNKEQKADQQGEIVELEIEKIKEPWQRFYRKTNFNLLFYTKEQSKFEIQDRIKLKNLIFNTPAHKQNLNQNPSYSNYLIKENILCSIFTKRLYAFKISSPNFCIKRWILNTKNLLLQNIRQKLSPKTFCYFSHIFLGNKKVAPTKNLKNSFNLWGISHYLARSGLHILLFILIWGFLLNIFPFSIYLKKVFLLLVCVVYHLFSWTTISFARALYVFILSQTGKILDFQTNFLHLLTLLCLIILLFNPIQLFFLDFQLTFGLAFALGLLGKLK